MLLLGEVFFPSFSREWGGIGLVLWMLFIDIYPVFIHFISFFVGLVKTILIQVHEWRYERQINYYIHHNAVCNSIPAAVQLPAGLVD